jgi:3-oxoacyl-[acyl-carrier-protein] synthase-3
LRAEAWWEGDPVQQAYIVGAGKCLPNQPIDNRDLENILGKAEGLSSRIKNRVMAGTGITARYMAIDPETRRQTHSNAQMSAMAVRSIAAQYGLPLEVDLLCCGTSSPDQMVPSHGQMVHGELKLPPLEVHTTAGVCCSGVTAIKHAYLSIISGNARRAIATGSELVSNLFRAENFAIDPSGNLPQEDSPVVAFHSDFLRWVLSDGAGALYLSNEPAPGRQALRIDWIEILSFANQLETCMYCGGQKTDTGELIGWRAVDPKVRQNGGYFKLSQDVRLLNEHIARITISEALPRIRVRRRLQADQIDWFLPHYSSAYFRSIVHDHLVEAGMPIPYDRWFTNLPYKGNTGSASIYLMIEEMLGEGRFKSGDRILCYVPESARFSVGYMHLTVI